MNPITFSNQNYKIKEIKLNLKSYEETIRRIKFSYIADWIEQFVTEVLLEK